MSRRPPMPRPRWALPGILLLAACAGDPEGPRETHAQDRSMDRREMIVRQLEPRGIDDPVVLEAVGRVLRHRFVPEHLASEAYGDYPLPIGHGQTISQPYIVAFMTQAAEVGPGDHVLEIGTGCGYQAAVLAEIVGELWSIEIVEPLAEEARENLAACGYDRVHVRAGDGYRGWPEEAPFDAILVTAAPDHVPPALVEQLAPGGRLVIPVGSAEQEIVRLRRTADGLEQEVLLPVRFVPMTGEAQER